jgi:hypothetical protein
MGAIQLKLHAFSALAIDTTNDHVQDPSVNGSKDMNEKDKGCMNLQRQLQGYIKRIS